MAGGLFGAVLGMALGGAIAAKLGWRWSFAGMALFGLCLAVLYPIIVKEARIAPQRAARALDKGAQDLRPLRTLWSSRSVVATYVGSGLQLFVGGTLMVWIPSYLNRYYAMPTDKAGGMAALIVLCSGVGMILCGMLSDRLCRNSPQRKVSLAIAFCLGSCLLLSAAFALQAGPVQLLLICLGMLIATGTTGPSGAMVANLTHYSVHGTAFATLTLANNLLGLAPGPFITGRVSDLVGLHAAFQLVPLVSLAAAAVFFYAKCHYYKDIARLTGGSVATPVSGAASEVKL
jgi:predicted MFS family arabinose efflux permease